MEDISDSFAAFVLANGERDQQLAYRVVGEHQAAEDAVQNAYARAFMGWQRITTMASPEAYVRRMVMNAAVDVYRQNRRRRGRERLTDQLPECGAEDRAISLVDERVSMHVRLGTLTPQQRAVVVLRYVEGLSEGQAATMLGMRVGTVKAHASRGLAKLRADLTTLDEGVRGGSS